MHEIKQSREQKACEELGGYLQRPSIFLALVALITLVLYSGALTFGFVWDDQSQIVNSPVLRSWSNLPRAFHSDLWYHAVRHQVYYRPLFVVWSMMNYTLFGLRPWGWHLGAILAHVAAIVAVFWLARRLRLEYGADIQLKSVAGPWIDVETVPFEFLESFRDLSRESDGRFEYTVAWLDCFTVSKARGIFFRGNHSAEDGIAFRRGGAGPVSHSHCQHGH